MTSEELKFLMNVFDKIQQLKSIDSMDANLSLIESKFHKYAKDSFAFQKQTLSDINENAIESVIRKLAQDFYCSFPYFKKLPEPIQNQLLQDYAQMEHQRRRDNFERYAQCIYQQIEAIVTHLFSNGKLWAELLIQRKNKPFSYKKFDPVSKTYSAVLNVGGGSVEATIIRYYKYHDIDYDRIFSQPFSHLDRRNSFKVQFRVVLYLLYFEAVATQEHFEEMQNTFEEIYVTRNTIHRGPSTFYPTQEQLVTNILKNKSYYYHKFFGALCEFVTKTLNSKNIGVV